MTIASGVRCEAFNKSINGSLVSSHIPDSDRVGFAVDIACTNSIDRYELVKVAQKLFKRIRIVGEHSGNFIHFYYSFLKSLASPLVAGSSWTQVLTGGTGSREGILLKGS